MTPRQSWPPNATDSKAKMAETTKMSLSWWGCPMTVSMEVSTSKAMKSWFTGSWLPMATCTQTHRRLSSQCRLTQCHTRLLKRCMISISSRSQIMSEATMTIRCTCSSKKASFCTTTSRARQILTECTTSPLSLSRWAQDCPTAEMVFSWLMLSGIYPTASQNTLFTGSRAFKPTWTSMSWKGPSKWSTSLKSMSLRSSKSLRP